MKTKIEIIFGFLGSGKTSFINSMLTKLHDEIIVIIQNEFGHAKINSSLIDKTSNLKIITIQKDSKEEMNSLYIEKILEAHSPQKIFIESNSFNNPSTITDLFKNTNLEELCIIDNVITLIDAENFNLYLSNMNYLLTSQISNSEKVIISNIQSVNKNSVEYRDMRTFIKSIKENIQIIEYENIKGENQWVGEDDIESSNFNPLFFMAITILLFGIFSIICFSNIISKQYISNFFISFKSMFIKELTFLLIGSFISSILHIFISNDILEKIFVRNIFISCIISGLAGMFFPVCGCGTILIAKVLFRKDIPKAACITFLLSSQILNPITVILTAFTFHNMKNVVLCYSICGFIISVIIGLCMNFFLKSNEIILENSYRHSCNCGFCSIKSSYYGNIIDTFKALFIHTENEFFGNISFIIIGIFFNSILQSNLALTNINVPKDNESSLILMILLAFIFSGSSCDSAVIGKNLLQSFSINSILVFLICSPMINIKNIIMLFGNFKRKFVLKLLFLILVISISILINIDISYNYKLLEGYIYDSIE